MVPSFMYRPVRVLSLVKVPRRLFCPAHPILTLIHDRLVLVTRSPVLSLVKILRRLFCPAHTILKLIHDRLVLVTHSLVVATLRLLLLKPLVEQRLVASFLLA
jgi:hypothetical protein